MAVSMAEAHERANRHPKYKTSCRIKNWQEYEKSLRKRGDIPFCNCRDQRSSKRERIGYILDGCQSYSKIESIRLVKKEIVKLNFFTGLLLLQAWIPLASKRFMQIKRWNKLMMNTRNIGKKDNFYKLVKV
jgi:hypothetical protein